MSSAPNVEISVLRTQLGMGSSDGVAIDNAADVRSNPKQAIVQNSGLAASYTYNANGGVLSSTGANSAANQSITATGLLTTDFVLGVTRVAAPQANLGFTGGMVSANDAVDVNFVTSNGAVTSTANQVYCITALRGASVISATISAANVVTKTATEQIFTITPVSAVATGVISGGQLVGATITSGGSGYYSSPTISVARAATETGTGTQATAIALIAGGAVIGIQITNPGSGYTVAPTFTFDGGNNIAPGMMVAVQKNAYQANLAIGNVRVAGNNQIGITYAAMGSANLTPTANETYKIFAFNASTAKSPMIVINANLANLTAAAANASNKTDVTVQGITSADMLMVMNKALASPLLFGGGVCSANTVTFNYGAGVPGATPANGIYNFTLLKNQLSAPIQMCPVTVTPVSVAANTAAELVVTLPTGFTVQANSTVIVNKPSCTPGIIVVGARANSTTTIGINLMNVTAAAITPPVETYLVANFPSNPPDITANQIEGYCVQVLSPAMQSMIDLNNEEQQVLRGIRAMKGA